MNAQVLKDKLLKAGQEALMKGMDGHLGGGRELNLKVDKANIMVETRAFSASPVDVHQCCQLVTRIIYAQTMGEKFSPDEMTQIFFPLTKLFQSTNHRLRRMVYLLIKNLEVEAEVTFMVTSQLMKDMNSKNDCYRGNSIRVLARIMDPNMAQSIDRYLKTAIVDKNAFVSSSALVCGLRLTTTCPEIVKRWINEVQDTVMSRHSMVQFHALALLYELKRTDRLALHKVIQSLSRGQLKSPMAECLLIRYSTRALMYDRDANTEAGLLQYLENCLRHKSDMVTYEAAKAFIDLAIHYHDQSDPAGSLVLNHDFLHAITLLQICLTSPKPVVRFAAIRTLNRLSQFRPHLVSRCNSDMEPLLSDSNRSVSTLALTTLLKTGHESNVDRLVKQISSFMCEISDSFKSDVIMAVKELCILYPKKHKILMGFLSANLREEGSADYKRDLTDALIHCTEHVPGAKECGLLHLCEFIEDCEYPSLCVKIIGLLGAEVPNTENPSKFVRFIYNRLILENALVRGAAVDALTKIAAKCDSLRKDIGVLLQVGKNDNDDEVRDRIYMYTSMIEQDRPFGEIMDTGLPFAVDALYETLDYQLKGDGPKDQPVNFDNLPTEQAYQSMQAAKKPTQEDSDKRKKAERRAGASAQAKKEAQKAAEAVAKSNAEMMQALSQLTDGGELGPVQHSCARVKLTDDDMEYTVGCVKHMFQQYVALEFIVKNTVEDVVLDNVSVSLRTTPGSGLEDLGSAAIPTLEYNATASTYTLLKKVGGPAPTVTWKAELSYIIKEDGDTEGYDDTYPIEPLIVSNGDYCSPFVLAPGQFSGAYQALSSQGVSSTGKFHLPFRTLQSAVDSIIGTLHMGACDNSQQVDVDSRTAQVALCGNYIGGQQVLAKGLVGIDQQRGCMLKLTIAAKDQDIVDNMLAAIQP